MDADCDCACQTRQFHAALEQLFQARSAFRRPPLALCPLAPTPHLHRATAPAPAQGYATIRRGLSAACTVRIARAPFRAAAHCVLLI
ncbi:uncharacterized protein TrAFT101_002489 [Trichoderma asperellum]|uniref:uncharacterized protein n=1 Tax=Trichoderma asperellum TaxID=101201 RepID=UPI003322165C|nr:hypothetical protein TrAFT101_002489 [Trichoderma asperellum]